MAVHWATATSLACLFVLGCTLFPFQFSAGVLRGRRIADVLLIGVGPDRSIDVVTNLLLFLPLGVALGGWLEQCRVRPARVIASVLLAGFSASYTLEIVQQFVPGRFSSLTDVAANTSGAVIGAIYYSLWRRAHFVSRQAEPLPRRSSVHDPEQPAQPDGPVQSAHD